MTAEDITTKFCKKCQAETERYARGQCKPCMKAADAARYADNPDKAKARSAAYRAANPEKVKAVIAAWHAANPERVKACKAAWQAANPANPEKKSAWNAKWNAANPEAKRIYEQNRRARKLASGGKLSVGLAAKLFKLQRGKCACGCKQPLGDDFHRDHIMPLALGGANEDWNMQLLCQTCNNQKSAKHPVDFMQQRGFLL